MSVFGNFAADEVVDAAEKVISKMDEGELASAIERSEQTMSFDGRVLLVEAIFDAFRQRGESSEDAAEGAGTTLEAILRYDSDALRKLLAYARANQGLLKEAAVGLIEREPAVLAQFSPEITGSIRKRLLEQ
jgi:NADH dehydrogenase FAD-containing subunit